MKSAQLLTVFKMKCKIKYILILFLSIIFNTIIASAAIAEDVKLETKITGGNWWGNLIIDVTNQGSQPIDGWKLEFDFPYDVGTPGTAVKESSDGNHHVFVNGNWNSAKIIDPGNTLTLSFGFSPNGKDITTLPLPTSVKFNGQGPEPSNKTPIVNFIKPSDNQTFTQKTLFPIDIEINATDEDGTISSASIQVEGQTYNGDKASWTPSSFGTYTINAEAIDNDGAKGTSSITVTIKEKDQEPKPPVATNDTASTNIDTPVTIDVLSNDSDPQNETIILKSLTTPQNGTAVIESGKIKYTPTKGYKGTDTFNYTIANTSGLTAVGLITVNVKEKAVFNKVNATYWCAWGGNQSYPTNGKIIESQGIEMDKIDPSYNVIITAFIVTKDGNFELALGDLSDNTDSAFSKTKVKEYISKTKAQGRKVLVSLGGAEFDLVMQSTADAAKFKTQVSALIDEYGFEGLDIDIEASLINRGQINTDIFGDAIKEIVDNYRNKGMDFWLTAAPEWPYIIPYTYGPDHQIPNSFYIDLINKINLDNFSYIWPQTYNQGSANGVTDSNGNKVTPGNGMDKFIAAIAWGATTTEGYNANGNKGVFIPKEKFALGIPATDGASGGNGLYTVTSTEIKNAWNQMISENAEIAGFMNWSVDWDALEIKNGELSAGYTHYPWETGKTVAEVLELDNPDPNTAPEINITSPKNNDVITQKTLSPITISITATDQDGSITSTSIDVDSQSYDTATANWTPSKFGDFTIIATATDDKGKSSQTSINVTVKEDKPNVNPVVNFKTPKDGDVIIQETLSYVNIQITATDEDGTISSSNIIVDNQTFNGTNANWVPTKFGIFIIKASATDDKGATIEKEISIEIQEKPSDPIIINDDTATVTQGNLIVIDALANDTGNNLLITNIGTPALGTAVIKDNKVEYTASSNSTGTDTFTYTINNTEQGNITVTVNQIPDVNEKPTVTITSHQNGAVIEQETLSPINIVIEAIDNDGTIVSRKITVDEQTFNQGTANWTPSKFATHTINAEATDNEGAIGTATIIITIKKKDIQPTGDKEIIAYFTQWDAWKAQANGFPAQGTCNQLNVDYSKYTMLNFSFFGVAKDGSLHSGDLRNKSIYQPGTVQEPGELLYGDIYSSFDYYLLYGELAPIWEFNAAATEAGYVSDPMGWYNTKTGLRGKMPIPLKKENGAKGLIELCQENNVKLMASIGGWSMCRHFPEMAKDPVKRQKFIDDCKRLINMGFAGIDIDWEYPGPFAGMNFTGSNEDYTNFTTLMKEIREAIGPDKTLTAAFSCAPNKLAGFEWSKLDNYMNFYNIMSYDINGGWSDNAGHNSPLYADQGELSWDNTYKYLTETAGVKPEKINMGVAFYGRGVITSGTGQLGAPTIKQSKFLQPDGQITTAADYDNWEINVWDGTPNYDFIMKNTTEWTYHWDDKAKVPYKTNGKYFLSYDNVESVELKANYVNDKNLGGVIIWQVFGDWDVGPIEQTYGNKLPYTSDIKTPLVDALNRVFNNDDNKAPTVVITSPEANEIITQTTLSPISITMTATDSDGEIVSTSIEVDDQSFNALTANWTPSKFGDFTIIAKATDNEGRLAETSINITVKDGNTNSNPVVNFTSPADGDVIIQKTLSPVTIQITATDEDGTITSSNITVEDKIYDGTSINWTPSQFGIFTLKATATDDKGAAVEKEISIEIKEKANDPIVVNNDAATVDQGETVTINALSNDTGSNLQITAIGNPSIGTAVIQNNKVVYSANANNYGTDTFTYTVNDIEQGIITVTVNKNGGNTGDVAIVVTPGNLSPWWNTFRITVTNNGSETIDGWKLEFDSQYAINTPGNTIKESQNGEHFTYINQTWEGAKVVNAGSSITFDFGFSTNGTTPNPNTLVRNVTFNGQGGGNDDNVVPTVAFTAPSDGDVIKQSTLSSINIAISATDEDGTIASSTIKVDNQTFNSDSADWTPSAFGTYAITGTAIDNEGATTTETISITIEEDGGSNGSAPDVSITTPYNGATIEQETLAQVNIIVEVSDADGDLDSVTITVDGQTFNVQNVNWTPTKFGSHTINVTAKDLAGNSASVFSTVLIKLKGDDSSASVRGWPNYIAMGAVTRTIESHHEGRPVDAVFKYAGDGGNGDRGTIKYPIYTHNTAKMCESLTGKYGMRVRPVMVVYTAEMSGGTNFEDLHIYDNLTKHFINLMNTTKIMQSYKTAENPYPGSIVLNADLLGMVQQQNLWTAIDATPIKVQEALYKAHHFVNDKFEYNGEQLTTMEIFAKMRIGKWSDWDVKVPWEEHVTTNIYPILSEEPVPSIPQFNNDFKGWIQATNWVIKTYSPDVTFGWQENIWSGNSANWVHNNYSETDIQQLVAGPTSTLWNNLEVYTGKYKPDFVAFDKYERDSIGEVGIGYFFNARDWDNYLTYARLISRDLGNVPVMLWQIPGGHLQIEGGIDTRENHAATAPNYFFGDTKLQPDLSNVKSYITSIALPGIYNSAAATTGKYLLENGYNWSTNNMDKAKDSNVFSILWGGGDTTSVGKYPSDDGGWLSNKVNEYYNNPTVLVE
ncbi:MAG TPA: glycosyl hydrolase family 18 protein [Victivallales bacterium]|nr:glycosyl hydrolase family 18 protein [Victivallales bacterium]